MSSFSQGLKRSDQIVRSFLNIYKTKGTSRRGDRMSSEDLPNVQVILFPPPQRDSMALNLSSLVSQALPALGRVFVSGYPE